METQQLQQVAKRLRRDILQATFDAKGCHLGSAMSCLNILIDFFYNGRIKDGDSFIFSKASGAGAYYAILADKGFFPKEKLAQYLHDYPLASKEVPGVIHSVGSIAHGLNVACGIAWADIKHDVYVLVSDGELQEGSTWEALWWANKHKLTNLHVYCDWNGYQACDKIDDVANGNLIAQVFMNMNPPNTNIVVTTKGKGVSFMEGVNGWHYWNLTPELLEQALKENE